MTISAKIIADSISLDNIRITTFELEYPRFVHSEFMTHRLFSRNAASSRAIPVKKAIALIRQDTARPVHWGKNQPGMSAKEECDELVLSPSPQGIDRSTAWDKARDSAISWAESFDEAGYHKQIVNRLMEPFTHIKVVVTATEYDNFFWLRNHADAQPEIKMLAEKMLEVMSASTPARLSPGEWHVPYYKDGQWKNSDTENTIEDALAISASCCAQVSYRVLDDSLEKAQDIFKRLVESKPVHASPFEHQATPMKHARFREDDQVLLYYAEVIAGEGTTHVDKTGYAWSGNFRGWNQHRQLINENACWDYDGT